MIEKERLVSLIQPECDHIMEQFKARGVGDHLQILVVATMAATLPELMNAANDPPVGAHVYVDMALAIALEGRGYTVTRRADA